MPTPIRIIGISVLCIPTAIPLIIVVAEPVSLCLAIFFTNGNLSEVYISVIVPISSPTNKPAIIAMANLNVPSIK